MANTAANADGLYLGARVSYSLSFDNHDVFDPRRIRCLGLGLKVADVKSTFLPPSPSFYFMRSCMGIYFYRRLVRWVSTFCQIPGEVLARRGMFWRGPLIKTKASLAVVKSDSPPAETSIFTNGLCGMFHYSILGCIDTKAILGCIR